MKLQELLAGENKGTSPYAWDGSEVTEISDMQIPPRTIIHNLKKVTKLENVEIGEFSRLHNLEHVEEMRNVGIGQFALLAGLRSLEVCEDVSCGKDVSVNGLISLTTLNGIHLSEGCKLDNLHSLKDPWRYDLPPLAELNEIPDDVEFPPWDTLGDAEKQIILRIDANHVDMSDWHEYLFDENYHEAQQHKHEAMVHGCNTSHCLAGWAQFIGDYKIVDGDAEKDGCRLLPSLQGYFFAHSQSVRDWLRKVQDEHRDELLPGYFHRYDKLVLQLR